MAGGSEGAEGCVVAWPALKEWAEASLGYNSKSSSQISNTSGY